MEIAFILDPLPSLKLHKDSSIAMMREAQRRGYGIQAVLREHLVWSEGAVVAQACPLTLGEGVQAGALTTRALTEFDAVLMRQDPPFDMEYVAATWLLQRAEAQGARIFNAPRAIRDHNEKFAISEFPEFIAPTCVARDAEVLQAFIDTHHDCIVKPLDGMGGSQVFRLRETDPNRNVILETLTHQGARTIMAQRYIPEITQGDKRVLLIDGEPVPCALARIPKAGETRGNLAAGGRGVAMPLTAREEHIARSLGPILAARGLLLVGLDVIGGFLTEINVTSPTCFVEITAQSGFDVAAKMIDALERRVAAGA
jgi:glutathione synthase